MKTSWYLSRLAAMSLPEVCARVARTARHRIDDAKWRFARPLWRASWEPGQRRLLAAPPPRAPLGFLTAARAHEVARACPTHPSAVVDLAVARRLRFFGHGDVALEEPIDFSCDPITGRSWPQRHAKLIDYRHHAPGDPKVIWELNRCQHVPGLIQAWLFSGEDRFAAAAVDAVLGWTEQQPPGRGIAWSNGFEVAMRAISFALCLDGLRGSSILTPRAEQAILLALFQHGRWIVRDPSTHSSANNHLVGELVGLATIALLAPELRSAPTWERRAVDTLAREAERQILADGLGAEQAFTYTLFVSDLFLLLVSLLQAQDRPVPDPILRALTRAGAALWAQLGEHDPAPTYGDTDDAWAVRLEAGELRDPRGVAATIAACTGSAEAAHAAARLVDPIARWLFQAGSERCVADRSSEAPAGALLETGGVAVLRDRGSRVMMDVGPLGYLSIAAHGHADALQVTLSDQSEELIVDPGVGSYFAHPEARRAFRGTTFHPTVAVDGLNQSEERGPFLWQQHAHAWTSYVDLGSGVVVGEHDGYRRLSDPVQHRRALIVLRGGPVLVYDRLEAEGEHIYRLSWPLHPNLDALLDREVIVATRDGSPRLLMRLLASGEPSRTAFRLSRGEEQPFFGWWSPRLESIVPAWHCALETSARGAIDLASLLLPVATQDWPKTGLEILRVGRTVVLRASVREDQWAVTIDLDGHPPVVVARPPC